MGAASAIAAATKATPPSDLRSVLSSLPSEEKAKLRDALATNTGWYVRPPLPDFLCVLDNKGGTAQKPRLAVVQSGSLEVVIDGDATVLQAQDLESVSLISDEGKYVACSSLGRTHVFVLELTDTGFAARHVASGQLPVPAGEETDSWQNPKRTNIEAARCFDKPPVELNSGNSPPFTHTIVWAARGGKDYAGVPGPCKNVWMRWAPFDPSSGAVDESNMKERQVTNLGDTGAWRAISSLDLVKDRLYFTAAFDGEEEGIAVDTSDVARTGTNRLVFRSLVGRVDLAGGEPEVIARFDGMKLECITALRDSADLLLASDDEALGCLIASARLASGGVAFEEEVGFTNLGVRASARYKGIAVKRWGVSGVAPLAFSECLGPDAEQG